MENNTEKKKLGRPRKYINGLATDYNIQSDYNADYYQRNKEKQRLKYIEKKEKITCECGRTINKSQIASHLLTNLHKRFLDKKNDTICIECN
tara:strand:+ start:575 stop:850 length:276 start_codon:yes stop_codon:yes gene_type:complete